MNRGRQMISVRSAGGVVTPWGGDEPDAGAIPEGISEVTALPGGFKTLACALRRPTREHPDLNRFDEVKARGPGRAIAWEGLQAEFPRHTGDDFAIDVNAVGWASHLLHDPSFRAIIIDRRSTAWGEAPQERIVTLAATDDEYGTDYTFENERGLHFHGTDEKAIHSGSKVEAWYRCPAGTKAERFAYNATSKNTSNMEAATLFAGDNEDGSAMDTYGLTTNGTDRSVVLTTPRRFLMLRAERTSVGTPTVPAKRVYSKLAVHGDHGLTPTTVEGDLDGYLASDVIRYIVEQTAPLLDPADIEESAFVIPHLVFDELTTGEDALLLANGFDLFDWGVYDNRRFFWRDPANYRRRWIARLSDGANFEDAGEVSETAVNGVIVSFTDTTGETRYAGPIDSGLDYEDASLGITDPENIVNAHGIPRKWGRLDVQYTTTALGAIRLGGKWLEQQEILPLRGSLTVKGEVMDADSRTFVPAWEMRAGDSVRVEDDDNLERRIVETNYTHDPDMAMTASLDNLPFRLDAMLERLGVVLVGVGD